MQLLAIFLCILLVTTRIIVVFGLDEDLTDEKVSANEVESDDTFRNGPGSLVKSDEYPMVVPKRAALLLDRIMVALQKALEDEGTNPAPEASERRVSSRNSQPPLLPLPRLSARDEMNSGQYLRMDSTNVGGLQRRGHTNTNNSNPKGRVWRCYFNAVTCFKK